MHGRFSLLLSALFLAGCATAPVVPAVPGFPTVSVAANPLGVTASNGLIFVASQGSSELSIIDAASDKFVKKLAIADLAPTFLRTFLDRRTVGVLDGTRGELVMIDAFKDNALIQTVPAVAGADEMAFADDNKSVLITAPTGTQAALLTFGDDRTQPPTRVMLEVGAARASRPPDARGGFAAFAAPADDTVRIANLATLNLKTVSAPHPGPVAVGLTSGKATAVIVGHTDGTGVTVIDPATGTPTVIGAAGEGATAIVTVPEFNRAFVTMSGSNDVAVIDYVTKKLLLRIPVGSKPTVALPAPPVVNELWVANEGDGTISVIDGKDMKVRTTVKVGQGKAAMTFWGSKGYVTTRDDATLTIIDRTGIR